VLGVSLRLRKEEKIKKIEKISKKYHFYKFHGVNWGQLAREPKLLD
jgi:hypothetical protein